MNEAVHAKVQCFYISSSPPVPLRTLHAVSCNISAFESNPILPGADTWFLPFGANELTKMREIRIFVECFPEKEQLLSPLFQASIAAVMESGGGRES